MASSCELSKLAYAKIILHAFKYPHTAINGVLLANEGSSGSSVKYVDAIPLFHYNLGLAPMLEVALMQVCIFHSFNLIIHQKFILSLSFVQCNRLIATAVLLV